MVNKYTRDRIGVKPYCKYFLAGIISMVMLLFITTPVYAQDDSRDDLEVIDYSSPKKYEIGGITVSGIEYLDQNVLIMLSGLKIGARIDVPGEEITNAVKKLWEQGLFEDVRISATRFQGDLVFLDIHLLERPRLTKYSFKGVKKSEADNIKDAMRLTRGDVVTDNLLVRITNIISGYFSEKGFLDVEVDIDQIPDTARANHVILDITVDKNSRVKIYQINIHDNKFLSTQKVKSALKETKEKGMFRPLYGAEKLIVEEELTFFQKEKIKVQNDLDAFNSKLSAQNEYLKVFQEELNGLDKIELTLKDLQRKVDMYEKNYQLYSARLEESRISKEMNAQKMGNMSVVERAVPPLKPRPLNRTSSVILSAIMGFFLGIAVALLFEFNSHSFNNREDISKNLQLKALASIPEFKQRGFKLNNLMKRFNH